MSTLAFITDSHIGSDTSGFQQQPRRPDLFGSIWGGVYELLRAKGVELLIHGGDLVDHGRTQEIVEASNALRDLEIPSVVCLGNHDLALPSSFSDWKNIQNASSTIHFADSVIKLPDVEVIALNTGWLREEGIGLYWEHAPACREAITQAQLSWLEVALASCASNRPVIVVLHVGMHPLSPEQTGEASPIHGALPSYIEPITEILNRHACVKLVLSGHNHVHCAAHQNGRVHLSTASLIEPPFELRVIHVSAGTLEIETFATIPPPLNNNLLSEKAWVMGRPQDRTLSLSWA